MHRSILLSLLVAVPLSAATQKITDDTYVDSFAADGKARTNFGGNAAVKAVSNNGSTGSPGDVSLTHGLFTLPNQFWQDIGTGPVTAPVTITFNIRNNSLARNPPASGFRQLEMLPLTQGFVAGTGGNAGSTTAGSPLNGSLVGGVPQYYGADWTTVDGLNPWATPGGTVDTTVTPITTTTPITSNGGITAAGTTGQTVATWDITNWLTNATTRANIKNFGLFVRVTDETSYTGNEFASFVSAESGAAAGTYNGLGPSVSYVPEPAGLAVVATGAAVALRRRWSA